MSQTINDHLTSQSDYATLDFDFMNKLDTLETLQISEFKTHCLRLLEKTEKIGKEYIITKKGVPIAQIIPIKKRTTSRLGSLEGLGKIRGDIVNFDTSADWEVLKK